MIHSRAMVATTMALLFVSTCGTDAKTRRTLHGLAKPHKRDVVVDRCASIDIGNLDQGVCILKILDGTLLPPDLFPPDLKPPESLQLR